MLIPFDQLLEGPGKGYSPSALAALAKLAAKDGAEPDVRQNLGPGRHVSAGCVVVPELTAEGLGKTWLRLPNGPTIMWGTWSFASGRVDPGESAMQAARREVLEEAGLTVSLLPGGYLGAFSNSYGVTHMYMAVQASRALRPHDNETKEVKLVTFGEAAALATQQRDQKILQAAQEWIAAFKKKHGLV